MAKLLKILILYWKELLKTLKMKQKNKKENVIILFLGMLLGTLGDSLLGNMSTRKGMLRAGYGYKERKDILGIGYRSLIKKTFWFHPIL